ncbi:hypothetical protein E0H40_35770 [Rhizobium leguminosarum bv. viciae]|nr:hypothetical protein E0H40_35770 [Rhizobium leguminosarum bv. viciae]
MNDVPCGPLIRPFGPPTGVEPRVSTRPSDPRWGEEGASPNAQRTNNSVIRPDRSRRDRQQRPGSSTYP